MLLRPWREPEISRRGEGELASEPAVPGDPRDRLPGEADSKIFWPRSPGGEIRSRHLVPPQPPYGARRKRENPRQQYCRQRELSRREALNPALGLDGGIRNADPKRESNSLTLNLSKTGRFPAIQLTNRRSRTLFTSPSIKNIATIFDPPELISGSGMPVTGILPTTIPTFTNM
jgi:hypothetical protein